MQQTNNEFIIEDFSFQPKSLTFMKYANCVSLNHDEKRIALELFKVDSLEACGISSHTRADMAYRLAWELSWSERQKADYAGLEIIFNHLQDLANLIRGLK